MFIAMTATNNQKCERCGEPYGEKDLRGPVCGWCADDLEQADEELAKAMTGERIHLTDADVAILWHARQAFEEGL